MRIGVIVSCFIPDFFLIIFFWFDGTFPGIIFFFNSADVNFECCDFFTVELFLVLFFRGLFFQIGLFSSEIFTWYDFFKVKFFLIKFFFGRTCDFFFLVANFTVKLVIDEFFFRPYFS